jgi:hypothetical protein
MDTDEFPDPAGGGGAGVGGGFDSAYIAAHGDANQARADEFLAGEDNIGGLHHGVGSFDCADQTFCFNQAEGLHHISSSSVNSLRYHNDGGDVALVKRQRNLHRGDAETLRKTKVKTGER